MNSQKTLTILALFLSISFYSFSMSCYSVWLEEFDDATDVYETNQSQCDGVLFGWDLCHHENELIYDQAIEYAGEEFICCVQGC